MKWKMLSIGMATMLTLVACGDNGDGNQEGQTNGNDLNTEQTRYNNTADDTNDRQPLRNVENDDNWDRNNNNQDNGDNNRYDVAEEAANKITDQIKEIDNAYVLTTENNAYVAAELDTDDDDDNNNATNNNNNGNDNGDELTDEVKQKISDIVKSVDKDIDNVYVSTNPDFVDLTNNYADDAGNGEPVEGFFDQIGNMIERIFPQDKK